LLTTLAETDGVDDLAAVAWLHRRAGFGLTEAALASAAVRGPVAELDRLLSPLAGPIPDDWDDRQLPIDPTNAPARRYAIDHWISRLVATRQPLAERLAWLWHGHFVSALDKVRVAKLMVDQIRLFLRAGLGAFPALVAAVAVDPGMLVYLDGRQSTAAAPNENFARELMELFTWASVSTERPTCRRGPPPSPDGGYGEGRPRRCSSPPATTIDASIFSASRAYTTSPRS
jgi:hypothetical protein